MKTMGFRVVETMQVRAKMTVYMMSGEVVPPVLNNDILVLKVRKMCKTEIRIHRGIT